MATRKKIPLIDENATLNVTGSVSIAGTGSAVITFPTITSTLATTADVAASRGFPYGASASGTNTALSLTNVTDTTITLNTELWDISSEYNPATFTYTAITTGYYQVNANVYFVSPTSGSFNNVQIKVNGGGILSVSGIPGGSNDFSQPISGIIKLNAGDAVILTAYQNSGGVKTVWVPNCKLSIHRIY